MIESGENDLRIMNIRNWRRVVAAKKQWRSIIKDYVIKINDMFIYFLLEEYKASWNANHLFPTINKYLLKGITILAI